MKAIVLTYPKRYCPYQISVLYNRLLCFPGETFFEVEFEKSLYIAMCYIGKEDPYVKDIRKNWSLTSKRLVIMKRLEELHTQAFEDKSLIQLY